MGCELIRIAVCDDQTECIEDTKRMIGQWVAASKVSAEILCFDNGDDLLLRSTKDKIDIVFLDIVMPLLNGMDTARELRTRDKTIRIVFLTSSPEFALESYSVKATDYCVKPVTYEMISGILSECTSEIETEVPNITIKTTCGYHKVYFYDIEYIEAQNRQVAFYLRSGQILTTSEPLYYFEEKLLKEPGFYKCHRSYLIYIPNVDNFSNNEINTKSGRSIPIARGCGKNFAEVYFAYVFRD